MTNADVLMIILTVFGAPLVATGTRLFMKMYQHFDKTMTAQDKANMEAEIQTSLGAGLAAAQRIMPGAIASGVITPQVRDTILAEGANFFRTRFPDRAAQVIAMVEGTSTQPVAALRQTLDARLANITLTAPVVAALGGVASAVLNPPATPLPGTAV